MSDCKHPLWERIRLCDNGACPDCLAARLAAAERQVEEVAQVRDRYAIALEEEQKAHSAAERRADEADRRLDYWLHDRQIPGRDPYLEVVKRAEAAEARLRECEAKLKEYENCPVCSSHDCSIYAGKEKKP